MTTSQAGQNVCPVCHLRFNSDRELQTHHRLAHSQQRQGEPPSEPEPSYGSNQGDRKSERIA